MIQISQAFFTFSIFSYFLFFSFFLHFAFNIKMAAYVRKYLYAHKEHTQMPLADLLGELTRRYLYELSNITMCLYQYIVSTFPQIIILLFIFLTYYYIKKARKGRQIKPHDFIDIHRTKQKCNFLNNLSKLLPQRFRNHVTNESNEATNLSMPRVAHIDTEQTISAFIPIFSCLCVKVKINQIFTLKY